MKGKDAVNYSVFVEIIDNSVVKSFSGVVVKVTIIKGGKQFEALGYDQTVVGAQTGALEQVMELAGI